ncbi:YggT family protein [Actinocrispum wychmicini]|uniref:YggT family protein n=1 Tax=Actinocrispum wychmicini TaxID=1213861 RepID=A0A4R2J490_9PSEU|nr:YggT family protein [Actinocrispum wychmicini]TCO53463.1 YggT family protein [Actinocrispum wychmicini]
MSVIGTLLGWILSAFVLVMLVRLVLDWTGVLAGGPYWLRRARTVSHALTEPVIAPVRRVLRPVRAGGMAIDLAFTAVLLLALVLRSVAFGL